MQYSPQKRVCPMYFCRRMSRRDGVCSRNCALTNVSLANRWMPSLRRVRFYQVVCALAEAKVLPALRHLVQSRWSSSTQLVPAYRTCDLYDEAPWGIGPEFLPGSEAA